MKTSLLPDSSLVIEFPDGSLLDVTHCSSTQDVLIRHSKPRHPETGLNRMPLYYSAPCPSPQ